MSKKPTEPEVEPSPLFEPRVAVERYERGGQPTVLEMFASIVGNPNIDPARIRELMELQKWAEERDAEKQFIAAMNRLQPKLPRIVKHGKIDLGRGKPIPFAKWEDIDEMIRPILANEGMALSFPTKVVDGQTVMICRISHVSGHSKESEMPLIQDKGPGRNDMQAWGSGRQYTKRYLACDLLNIVTIGEDNDAQSLSAIDENQRLTIETLIGNARLTPAGVSKFLEFVGAKSIGDIQKGGLAAAVNYLQAKHRQAEEAALKQAGERQ